MSPPKNPSPGFARNPAKQITILPHEGAVTVRAGGVVVAETSAAKVLTESPYPPVFYIPFGDIDFASLEKTTKSSHCPFKGDASYWTIVTAGPKGENAMWAYEDPFDEMAAIKEHGAFYSDRVTIEA